MGETLVGEGLLPVDSVVIVEDTELYRDPIPSCVPPDWRSVMSITASLSPSSSTSEFCQLPYTAQKDQGSCYRNSISVHVYLHDVSHRLFKRTTTKKTPN